MDVHSTNLTHDSEIEMAEMANLTIDRSDTCGKGRRFQRGSMAKAGAVSSAANLIPGHGNTHLRSAGDP